MSTVSYQPNKKRGSENHSTGGSTNLGTEVSGSARTFKTPTSKQEGKHELGR